MPPGAAIAMNLSALLLSSILAASSLALLPSGAAPDLTGGVTNLAPVVTSVTLGSGALTPTAGSTTNLVTTIIVADDNGYNDITGVTVAILRPDGSTVHQAATAATFSSGSGLQATYVKTLTMNYYDPAALLTSTYKVKVEVTDSQGATGNNLLALATFNFGQLAALNAASSVDLGSSLAPGEASPIGAMQVSNYGNVQIDAQVSGTAPANSDVEASLPVGSVSYSLNADLSAASPLSISASGVDGFDLGAGAGSARNLYWRMTVPSAEDQYVPAGTYASTVTVTAVAG
jgi:hypothetical protein